MKKEELSALGITDENAIAEIMRINGKDIEHAKKAKDGEISTLTAERDSYKSQYETADAALKKFDGIDPQKIQDELAAYKKQADEAKERLTSELLHRDQRDWIKSKMDEYGVTSPYARTALESECMHKDTGLSWKDGAFMGFDDFMKAAKEKDSSLYKSAEEKAEEAKAAEQKAAAPFIGSAGGAGGSPKAKYTPPKLF